MKISPLEIARRALFARGYFVRKSRAGVKYIVPFSRAPRLIQPGKPTSDGRVYVRMEPSARGKRGNLVRVETEGSQLAQA